ncbi:MAG: hypothetical protein AB8C02_05155 [Halioglobus sp.]
MSCIKRNGVENNQGDDLLKRIEVKPPYLALKQLGLHEDGSVSAQVVPEQPHYNELGPMAGAEAGRHLAIIGSCALAAANPRPGKHFYLAQQAKYRAHPLPKDYSLEPLYRVTATPGKIEGRVGYATTALTTVSGTPIVSLDVEYHVMSEKMFQKLFSAHRHPPTKVDPRAYQKDFLFPDHEISNSKLHASIDSISPSACPGHFEHYPCVPVAVLMAWLTQAAGKLLEHNFATPMIKFRVEHATVSAERLAFANQAVHLQAEITANNSDSHSVSLVCTANDTDGMAFGGMELTLSLGHHS